MILKNLYLRALTKATGLESVELIRNVMAIIPVESEVETSSSS